ncbi:unnamed protein product [Bursaphelenchus okinawaensis]|uniref:DOMON domain-containing protein n=1 Tax=Bursaphelenchus okinawaensis TaxID=465554 RepID=A0A811JTD8_9BILA|nr:unnamed protein product [Bursaphelenchus okinawaensis]CAG9082419.1 unnamed protein product [Bursaphelenchus okinawaensis]
MATRWWIVISSLLLGTVAFDREFCHFSSPNYNLEWAYESTSKTIVFVLKVNSTMPRYWTGVGFSGKKGPIDFVGVLVRDQQVVLADAYLNETGILYTDVLGNVQTIGYDYDGHQLVAKFARPILSDDVKSDQQLDECTTFLLPQKPGVIPTSGIKPNLEEFNKVAVCDIQQHCHISINKKEPKESQVAKEDVRFAKSVDISGTGDPCGFVGHDYMVNWTYDKADDKVNFVYRFPSKKGKYWSALGIGDNMSDMDIAVLFLEDGDVKKIGDYFSSGYGVPDEDSTQDWSLDSSKKVESNLEIHFSRKVVTEDPDKDRPMDDCVLFQFGVNSGKYAPGYKIRKHDGWPDLYKACNLRDNCAAIQIEKRKSKNKKQKAKKEKEEEEETTTPVIGENSDQEDTNVHKKGKGNKKQKNKAKKADDNDNIESSGQEEVEGSGQDELTTPEELKTSTILTTVEATTENVPTTSEAKKEEPTTVATSATTSASDATTTELEASSTTSEAKTTSEAQSTASVASEATTAAALSSGKKDTCNPNKQDLNVCEGYMNNYLAQVKEWAERHDETIEQQYGKACALLSAVPHVPTLCCHVFQKVCEKQISS